MRLTAWLMSHLVIVQLQRCRSSSPLVTTATSKSVVLCRQIFLSFETSTLHVAFSTSRALVCMTTSLCTEQCVYTVQQLNTTKSGSQKPFVDLVTEKVGVNWPLERGCASPRPAACVLQVGLQVSSKLNFVATPTTISILKWVVEFFCNFCGERQNGKNGHRTLGSMSLCCMLTKTWLHLGNPYQTTSASF